MADDFVIRIRAADNASATIEKINAALARISGPTEKLQKRVGRLGDMGSTGLDKLSKGFGRVESAARGVVDKIVEIVPGLTAITGAASLAGLSALAVKFGNVGFSLNKSSKLLGMNAQDLAAWHVAAKRAGVSAEEFDSSMNSSQMAIRGAAYGANPEAMMYLQKMGVQIQRNRDGSIDYLKTQQQIMAALGRQKSVEGQRAAAGALGMGSLLPMIQQGTYNEDKARAMRKGLVPSADEIARTTEFHKNINDLEDSVSGLGNSIGSKLVPILDPLVRGFSKWLDAHRAQIAQQIGDAVQKFADWLQSIDWEGVVSKAGKFFDAIGGIKGVLIAVTAITLAGPISGVTTLATSLLQLTSVVIPGAVTALGTLGAAGIAAWAALKVAKMAGLPDVDGNKGADDVRNGNWWSASTHLSAGDFIGALSDKFLHGKTNAEIAEGLAKSGRAAKPGGVAQAAANAVSGVANAAESPSGANGISASLASRAGYNAVMAALQTQQRYGVPAAVTLAQYGLESGFGTSGLAKRSNNPFGMHAAPGQDYVWGTDDDGHGNRVPTKFARFASIQDAFDAHGRLLANNKAYAEARQHEDDPTAYAAALTGHYATDPQYGAKLQQMMGDSPAPRAAPASSHVHVTFDNVPAGVRVNAQTPDGGYLPTRVNYAMNTDYGAIP